MGASNLYIMDNPVMVVVVVVVVVRLSPNHSRLLLSNKQRSSQIKGPHAKDSFPKETCDN